MNMEQFTLPLSYRKEYYRYYIISKIFDNSRRKFLHVVHTQSIEQVFAPTLTEWVLYLETQKFCVPFQLCYQIVKFYDLSTHNMFYYSRQLQKQNTQLTFRSDVTSDPAYC
jgi:hypothetical protein